MAERKPEWPEIGDLVIATIETVTDYGAYAKLDEYNKRGLLHVSEISSSWIRNIRDFVREGQKMVFLLRWLACQSYLPSRKTSRVKIFFI